MKQLVEHSLGDNGGADAAVAIRRARSSNPHRNRSAAAGSDARQRAEHQGQAAARLGMWLFLATEALMFGGLFCLYVVLHARYAGAFDWGRGQLDIGWGFINTLVLLVSSFTVAMALYSAQTGRSAMVALFLTLTVMCGLLFLGVKTIEYEHKFHEGLLWAGAFSPHFEQGAAVEQEAPAVQPAAALPPALARGKRLFEMSCASCHGREAQGIVGGGLPLAGTSFMQQRDDAELATFVMQGRSAADPESQTGLAMPPNGGNPALMERDVLQIIGFLRTLEPPAVSAAVPDAAATPPSFRLPRSLIAVATEGPSGTADWVRQGLATPPAPQPQAESTPALAQPAAAAPPPAEAGLFFSLYFLMTGLHAVHLLVGIGVLLWLLARTWRGRIHRRDYMPLEIGGLYWHLVDVVWILLFPMLYLVH